MVYKFEWKNKRFPVPAQQAGEYLQEICEHEKAVTAERLLELSRAEDALLHKCFEWDDTKAAEKYRLKQSGEIIRNLVAVKISSRTVEPVRAFVSVTPTEYDNSKGQYKPITVALGNVDDHRIVLRNAFRDIQLFREKYRNLGELSRIFTAIDETLDAAKNEA